MVAKFFGEFLHSKKLINQEQLDQVLEVQKHSNKKLGELAVSTGMLTENCAQEINLRQQIENKFFGQIAIELGLLDENQIEELLLVQQKQRKYFGEILVELEILSQNEIDKQLHSHDQAQQQAYQKMLLSIKQYPFAQYVTEGIETVNRLFVRILHVKSKFYQLLNVEETLPAYEVVCQIALDDNNSLALTLATEAQTAMCIASRFTVQDIADCDLDFSIDATSEFLNILSAQLTEQIGNTDAIPSRIPNRNINLAELRIDADAFVAVEMDSQIGDFLIIISQNL